MLLITVSLFSPMRALALGAMLALAVAILLREKDASQSVIYAPDPWLIGCVLLALLFRENFSTNYLGGQDPGAYVSLAGIIEHFGGLNFPDTFRSTLPSALKQLYDLGPMGEQAQVLPVGDGLHYQAAWYPLHPGWMALFSGLFGEDAHGLAMLLFSLLGVTGGYFLTRELAGNDDRLSARLTALLMAINPALCFMAKFPLTEAQTAALLLNAGYLLAKGIKAEGRNQLLLLGSSLLLLLAYFFTRLSFPILIVPWAALYAFSCSQALDRRTARRLRTYLWLIGAAGILAAVFYFEMMPLVFDAALFIIYWPLVTRHAVLAVAVIVGLAGLSALPVEPIRTRLKTPLDFAISCVERGAPWLPIVVVLAGLPGVLKMMQTGHLFGDINVSPELTGFRYSASYRWMLAITPFLWCLLLALPAFVKRHSTLTIPLLFLGATMALTEVWAPSLPYLYYHVRYLSSEVVPVSLVIMSIVLVTMWQTPGWKRQLAIVAVFLSVLLMGAFSALQMQGKEGEDPRFLHEIDSAVSDGDVLIMDERDAWLTVPIRYFFNKSVFIMPEKAKREQRAKIVDYLLDNSGSKYGRILLLAQGGRFRLPFTKTVERTLTYRESVITNSEHWRSGGFQSRDLGHFILPYAWHTDSLPYTLYRLDSFIAHDLFLGCPIGFSENGNSDSYIGTGWGDPEESFRWTVGRTAVLRVKLEWPPGANGARQAYLDFQADPFGPEQRVLVSIDGKQVSELNLEPARHDYEIALDLTDAGDNAEHEIVFHLPDAHSPKSSGSGGDSRELGMAMKSLTFYGSEKAPGKQCD